MKVKICGVCRPQDAAAAAAAGADYVGVILAPGYRRTQSPESAAEIFRQAGTLQRVGVFVNPDPDAAAQLAADLRLDVLQLHGAEEPEAVAHIAAVTGKPVWKTVWLREATDLPAAIIRYGETASGLLLDAKSGAETGGTGVRFDWALAEEARSRTERHVEIIVAGGLTPENVRQAIDMLRPDIVDVASGVESAPGEKSHTAIKAFVRNAKI